MLPGMLHACDFRHGRRGFWAIVESGMGSCRVFYSLFFCEIFLSGYNLETDSTCSLMLPCEIWKMLPCEIWKLFCTFRAMDHFQHKDRIIHCKLWREQIYIYIISNDKVYKYTSVRIKHLLTNTKQLLVAKWFGEVGNCPLRPLEIWQSWSPRNVCWSTQQLEVLVWWPSSHLDESKSILQQFCWKMYSHIYIAYVYMYSVHYTYEYVCVQIICILFKMG